MGDIRAVLLAEPGFVTPQAILAATTEAGSRDLALRPHLTAHL